MGRDHVWTTFTCAQCGEVEFVRPCNVRKYCSQVCRTIGNPPPPAQKGNKLAWKGDKATVIAMRWRANQMKPPSPCERCGGPGQVVHHRDHNPRNNVLSNLERLCRACHARHHQKERQLA